MRISYPLNSLRVVITGGMRGIGSAIAKYFHDAGSEVIITGSKAASKIDSIFDYYQVELHNNDAILQFKNQLKIIQPDILINNAGINEILPFEEITADELLNVQKINFFAPFAFCQGAVVGMKKKKWGRIINISSIWGENSKIGRGAYTTSKFALNGLTKNLALEMAAYNILVNSVSPGFTETDLSKKTLTKQQHDKIAHCIPLRRFAKPHEIASLVGWLSSEENSYLTGQIITIDGGYTCT